LTFFKSATLSIRLTKIITLLTVCLFLLFSLVTFFVAYSLEDNMLNQQLFKANIQLKQQGTLPFGVEKKSNLLEFGLTLAPNNALIEFDADDLFGEFSHKNEHYHYMKLTDGLLLMNVTTQVVVKRSAKDIFVLLLMVFIPCLCISVFIARGISRYALMPFHRLSEHFQQKAGLSRKSPANSKEKIIAHQLTQTIDIEEADVKEIAEQLEQALEQQQRIVEQQVMFNQGMSHEIRTPLQVMSHSAELIEAHNAELYCQPAMQRLVKSITRIKRISSALLWLTSQEEYQESCLIITVLEQILEESQNIITAHQLKVTVENVSGNAPKVTLPVEVLELIFLNLINNAIHHGKQDNHVKALRITLDKNKITFFNEKATTASEHQSFRLGLQLIDKLSERFKLTFTNEETTTYFKAMLYYP
jgi:signal transduction histidine kinase